MGLFRHQLREENMMTWSLIIHMFGAFPVGTEGSTISINDFASEQLCKDALAVVRTDLRVVIGTSQIGSVAACVRAQLAICFWEM